MRISNVQTIFNDIEHQYQSEYRTQRTSSRVGRAGEDLAKLLKNRCQAAETVGIFFWKTTLESRKNTKQFT